MDKLTDTPIFNSLPGAGTALSSQLLAAYGEQRDRFKSAPKMQQCAGITKWTKILGSLALAMLNIFTTNIYRMGNPFTSKILLG